MYGIINKTNVQNVKNTMLDSLFSTLAPHLCYNCGEIGTVLCDYCKYNIVSDPFVGCVICESPTSGQGVCGEHDTYYSAAWCVGERSDVLKRIIDDFKFQRLYAAHGVLAQLLAEVTPVLAANCIIVPVPTNASHVRQRGFDHTFLLARQLARIKNIPMEQCLKRNTSFVQTGHSRANRLAQAESMFGHRGRCHDKTVLLIDDIITTGATVNAAARMLRGAGAQDVWVAALARQPLD